MKQQVTDFFFYRWRYVIGMALGIAILVGVLIYTATFAPNSLREAEQISSIASEQLSFTDFDPNTVVNLPYHILQKLSFMVFGITQLSIKLPSLIFGVLAMLGVYMLITTWFRRKVGIIMTIVATTMPVFMFMTQDGTPLVYSLAISVWLLTIGTFVSRRHQPYLLWKIVFLVLLALNLYTPLGVYLNIAIVSTLIFHPHIRHLARKFNPNRIVIASVIGLITLVPLLFSLVNQPSIVLQLLGVPESMPPILENLSYLLSALGGFSENESALLAPLFSIPFLILLALGLFNLIRVKYTARSYIMWLWGALLIPIVVLSPDFMGYGLALAILIATMGIDGLIRDWYKMFPLNPYARVAGLIPLSLIIIGLITSNFIAYGLGYKYSPSTLSSFNNDLVLLDSATDKLPARVTEVVLVVDESNQPFYELVANHREDLQIVTPSDRFDRSNVIVHSSARDDFNGDGLQIDHIVTNTRSSQADRFYVYSALEE